MPTYAFLTAADVRSRIRDEHRHDLRDWDQPEPDPDDAEAVAAYQAALQASDAVELSCESMALAKIRSALHGRYDVDALYAATGDDRSPLLVLHVLNTFVYLLYRRINPRKIPQEVKDDHDETLAWLERVANHKETPDFPPITPPEEDTNHPRLGGGQPVAGGYY